MKHKLAIAIVVIVVIFIAIIASSTNVFQQNSSADNSTNSSGVTLKIIAQGPWKADINDGGSIDNIYNNNNATYNLKGNSHITVTVMKYSTNNGYIEAQLIKDGKIISNQSTNAPLGVISVNL